MIKGVSRQIIEVTQTENNFFERAWLVIKPEYLSLSADSLEQAASNYLKDLAPPKSLRKSRKFFFKIAEICVSAVAGSVITSLIFMSGIV